jgi:hypothetical protein
MSPDEHGSPMPKSNLNKSNGSLLLADLLQLQATALQKKGGNRAICSMGNSS